MHEVGWVWKDEVDGRVFFDSDILDVIASKSTEIALAQSRERYRHLVDRAPIAIWILVACVCRYANAAASERFGSSRPALAGRPVSELFADPGLCSILARGYDGDRPVSFAARPSLVRRGVRGCARVEISGVAFEQGSQSAWQVVIAELESAICGRPRPTSSGWTSSRRSSSAAGGWSASRPCCAGAARAAAWFRLPSSSRSPKRPA